MTPLRLILALLPNAIFQCRPAAPSGPYSISVRCPDLVAKASAVTCQTLQASAGFLSTEITSLMRSSHDLICSLVHSQR